MAKDKILKPFLALVSPENKFSLNTIDDLASANYFVLGDVVEVLGFYEKGDGGSHKRVLESENDGSGIKAYGNLGYWNIVKETFYNVKWFGARDKANFDNSDIIQNALNFLFEFKHTEVLFFPSGEYEIHKPIYLNQKLDFWKRNGNVIKGESSQNTKIIKKHNEKIENVDCAIYTPPRGEVKGSAYILKDINVTNESSDPESWVFYSNYFANSILRDFVGENKAGKGLYLGGNCFSNDINNLRIFCRESALVSKGTATSNNFRNIYTAGVLNPYVLTGIYTTIDNVFADNCTGVIFDLSGTLNAINIGTESARADTVVRIAYGSYKRKIKIGTLWSYPLVNESACMFEISGESSYLDCDIVEVSTESGISPPSGGMTLLNFSKSRDNPYTVKFGKVFGEFKNIYDSIPENVHPRTQVEIQNIRYGGGGKFSYVGNPSVNTGDHRKITLNTTRPWEVEGTPLEPFRYGFYYSAGDIITTNKPLDYNCAGWVVKESGKEVGTTFKNYAQIPIIMTDQPVSNLYEGLCYYDTNKSKPYWYRNFGWFNANGEADWQETTFEFLKLDTNIFHEKMKEQGVFEEFVTFLNRRLDYDAKKTKDISERIFSFESREDQEQTYEEWLATQPALIPDNEPQPSEKLLEFKNKYIM